MKRNQARGMRPNAYVSDSLFTRYGDVDRPSEGCSELVCEEDADQKFKHCRKCTQEATEEVQRVI